LLNKIVINTKINTKTTAHPFILKNRSSLFYLNLIEEMEK